MLSNINYNRTLSTITVLNGLHEYKKELADKHGIKKIHTIWIWNLNVSSFWGSGELYGVSNIGKNISTITDRYPELGILNVLLSSENDTVICEDIGCNKDILELYRSIGLNIPKVIFVRGTDSYNCISEALLKNKELKSIVGTQMPKDNKYMLACFGNGIYEQKIASKYGTFLFAAGSSASAKCNNKATTKELCESIGIQTPVGSVCSSIDEAQHVVNTLFKKYTSIVIKEPYGISGKGMIVVHTLAKAIKVLQKIERGLRDKDGNLQLIIERWYDIECSYNHQYIIMPSGKIAFIGFNRQILRDQRYQGNYISKYWHNTYDDNYVYDAHVRLAEKTYKMGYYGIIGIDSIITKDGFIFPVIEINARLNLSTYIFALLEKLHYFHDSCVMTYSFKWNKTSDLYDFITYIGKNNLYKKTSSCGYLMLNYPGSSLISTKNIMKIVIVYMASKRDEIAKIKLEVEKKLSEYGYVPSEYEIKGNNLKTNIMVE